MAQIEDASSGIASAGHPPDVQAVVVSHDSGHVLTPCLSALAREGVPAIVVDNASRDGSAETARSRGATVVANPRNEGFGRAMNIGVRAATARWCLLTNPDIVYDPGAVAALLQAAARYSDAGILAPRLVEPDGRVFWQARSALAGFLQNPAGSLGVPEGDCCAPFLSGAAMLVDRALFLRLGGFDEAIFLFYEDDDLCRRVSDAGRSLVHVHAAVARHARGASSAPARGRVFRARWHMAWSHCYVSRKWGLPDPAGAILARNAPKAALAALALRRPLMERYGGSAAGALAWLRGRSALEREGLS